LLTSPKDTTMPLELADTVLFGFPITDVNCRI